MKNCFKISILVLNLAFAVGAVETWTVQNSGTTKNLHDISCPALDTCYAVGDSGLILTTRNGGALWTAQTNGTRTMVSASFGSTSTGYISNGSSSVIKTLNGGVTWSSGQSPSAVNISNYSSISFASSNSGCIAGSGSKIIAGASTSYLAIVETSNGGTTWSNPYNATNSNISFSSIYLWPGAGTLDDYETIWAVGATSNQRGVVVKQNFNGSGSQTFAAPPLSSVVFVSLSTGWVVGDSGVIYKTSNMGGAWAVQTSGSRQNLRSVRFVGGNLGYVVGDSGVIFRTANGGTNWMLATSGTTKNLSSISIVSNGASAYAVGDGGTILKMTGGTAVGILQLNVSKGRLNLRATGDPWYGFELPDNRVFNVLGRQPMLQSFPLPTKNQDQK